jgi:hypothetical protein
MRAYKVELLIIDFDNVGDEIKDVIENQKFPNYCIHPEVIGMKSVDIGDWDDDHPLNLNPTLY